MYVVLTEAEYREAVLRQGEALTFTTVRSVEGKTYKVLKLKDLVVIPQPIADTLLDRGGFYEVPSPQSHHEVV